MSTTNQESQTYKKVAIDLKKHQLTLNLIERELQNHAEVAVWLQTTLKISTRDIAILMWENCVY